MSFLTVLAATWPGFAAPASAQTAEVVGTRALGMGGAFVAVADDPSAVYWNPAGLPRMGVINLGVDWQSFDTGSDTPTLLNPAAGGSSALVALTTPPLGVSYLRLRQENRPGYSLVTHNIGASLVQSIGERIDVATTIRFVHGEAAVADLPGKGSNTADFDVAAMVMLGRGVRAGLIVRNLLEPEFDTPVEGSTLTLERQARAGVAWHGESSTVAVDVDLLETESVLGPRRHVAFGGEQWFADRRIAARAGFRLNTVENALPTGTAGVSVRVTSSIFADAQVTRGASDRDRGWGISLRYAY
jgi:F plasmid transfer operon, TraF, protein